jgi:hypothetical protein
MEDDLREVVARAMWNAAHLQQWDGPARPGSCAITEFDRQTYRDAADAAIAAARPVIEREAGQYAAAVLHDLSEAKREISTLRDALVTYGDRVRMAMAASPAMQQAIDRAFDRDN